MNRKIARLDANWSKRAERVISGVRERDAKLANDYRYDVFISYRRDSDFDVWMATVVGHLKSELKGYLGRDAAVFFDVREIKLGDRWNDDIRSALKTSKCLVPFVSLDYFGSDWCRAEFKSFQLRPGRVIAPIAVHTAGGRLLQRAEFSNLQYLDVQKYHQASPVFWQNPTLAPEFESLLRSKVSDIFARIESAPAFRPDFPLADPEQKDAEAAPAPVASKRIKAKSAGNQPRRLATALRSSQRRPMVFLNTPFTDSYRPLFEVIVFTVMSCGFTPRSVLEFSDGSVPRLDRLSTLVRESSLSIHDLASGTQGNVPLELGMFLAGGRLTATGSKVLILDKEPHAYREFLSDLSGLDVHFHKGDQQALAAHVRNWLASQVKRGPPIPGTASIWNDYKSFRTVLPKLAEARKREPDRIAFQEFAYLIDAWLKHRAAKS